MKELSIEEKAKAYDKALDRAKELLEIGLKDTRDKKVVLSFFPELKESEDERIRKAILEHIQLCTESIPDRDKFIAWLEKQGEQREQLINKACDVLVNCIEDFMLRRMEIWDEECKKQTLENIRKKLEE